MDQIYLKYGAEEEDLLKLFDDPGISFEAKIKILLFISNRNY
jgi:hypothetical protein